MQNGADIFRKASWFSKRASCFQAMMFDPSVKVTNSASSPEDSQFAVATNGADFGRAPLSYRLNVWLAAVPLA
jgi:hypothetical protein